MSTPTTVPQESPNLLEVIADKERNRMLLVYPDSTEVSTPVNFDEAVRSFESKGVKLTPKSFMLWWERLDDDDKQRE